MKVCIIQPEYSTDYSRVDELFKKEIEYLEKCTPDMDLIVMPENCDVPALPCSVDERHKTSDKYNPLILKKAKETAIRCQAVVFLNGYEVTSEGKRNTTYAINKNGEIAGCYYKKHLVANEVCKFGLDNSYTLEFSEPTIIEIDGIRYGFLTCYDFYFYEAFANIARYKPDIIIGCSHQRSDSHTALEIFSRSCAYNCNAYVVRSSVSMDVNSDVGGASMIVAPSGEVLLNMYSKIGMECIEIDPHKKYTKPMGFGNPDGAHYEYIEQGRRPWQYRPSGSAIVKYDSLMPYPRVCAHHGFYKIAPESSMAAFGAAVSMGAEEIEFSLWATKDGEIVVLSDADLSLISIGDGYVYDKTYNELLEYDFGIKYSENFIGLKILKFEDVLKKFSCHTIMNINLKTINNDMMEKILYLIHKYDCKKHIYFTTESENILSQFKDKAPDITRCFASGNGPYKIIDTAIKYGCKKVQICKSCVNKEIIDYAHQNNIKCNVFFLDDYEEAKEFIKMGIDTILTTDYHKISNVVKNM